MAGSVIFFPCCVLLSAVALDESKLPPPATITVDFTRDIKPVLDASCARCHGPEKPKSRFRLDNREAALKGGDNGRDILPGDSAKSPLIHYVAHLVEDMEMPPVGKGEQLTAEQVGLLRAWIDQGAVWEAAPPTNNFSFSASPIFGWTSVSGDKNKFRELYWQKEGFNGGAENFEWFEQTDPNTKLLLTGHALLDDYKVGLSVDRNELGFIHSGWEQYRKYYDDTGGYRPTPAKPFAPSLGSDLHLDLGKAWIDFGLTLPRWPQLVFGYEYDYKHGEEATTTWNNYNPGGIAPNLVPATKAIHEETHIIKFDLDDEIRGVTVEERFRGEFYQLNTGYTNSDARSGALEKASEGNNYFQGVNTLRLEKKFTDWFFGSGGYLYSKLNADSTFTDTMNNATLNTIFVNQVPWITLEKESHVLNLNGLLGPFDCLTLAAGVQSEWTRETGFGGGAFLNQINSPNAPISTQPVLATTLSSDYDEVSVLESLALRYTKIPWTVLFAEARLQQQSIGQFDSDVQVNNPNGDFLQNTDFSSRTSDLRLGFSTSPWKKVSLSAHYRRYEIDSHYDSDTNSLPRNGYPGFLLSRDVLTDEVGTKLVLHPRSWFKTTLSCQFLNTDYGENTGPATTVFAIQPGDASPGGPILAGQSDSRIYSILMTLIPHPRLYLDTTFSYQTSTTDTAHNDLPAVVPYSGHVYSALASGTYALSQTTDLFASYAFSKADYAQDNFAAGVPVGIQYQQHAVQVGLARRIGKNVTARLRYGYYNYDEPSSGGTIDYVAHSVFGTVSFKLR